MPGPLSLGNSFPGNSDAYSQQGTSHLLLPLLCTDEKRRPTSQGWPQTSSAGGTRCHLGESHYSPSLAWRGRHPSFLLLQRLSFPGLAVEPAWLRTHRSAHLSSHSEELSFLPPSTVHCLLENPAPLLNPHPATLSLGGWFKADPRGHISMASVVGSRVGMRSTHIP